MTILIVQDCEWSSMPYDGPWEHTETHHQLLRRSMPFKAKSDSWLWMELQSLDPGGPRERSAQVLAAIPSVASNDTVPLFDLPFISGQWPLLLVFIIIDISAALIVYWSNDYSLLIYPLTADKTMKSNKYFHKNLLLSVGSL